MNTIATYTDRDECHGLTVTALSKTPSRRRTFILISLSPSTSDEKYNKKAELPQR